MRQLKTKTIYFVNIFYFIIFSQFIKIIFFFRSFHLWFFVFVSVHKLLMSKNLCSPMFFFLLSFPMAWTKGPLWLDDVTMITHKKSAENIFFFGNIPKASNKKEMVFELKSVRNGIYLIWARLHCRLGCLRVVKSFASNILMVQLYENHFFVFYLNEKNEERKKMNIVLITVCGIWSMEIKVTSASR